MRFKVRFTETLSDRPPSGSLPALTRMILLVMMLAIVAMPEWAGPARAGDKTLTLVVLGDSLVAGYGLEAGEAFPEKLGAALAAKGHDVEVINAGVSGDTSAGGLERLDWSVPETADAAIVELGANDALRGLAPSQTRKNLDAILTRLTERGVATVLAGMMAPPNMGEDYAREFNAIYPELAKEHVVLLYPFFLDGVAAVASLNQADGMHPTAEGIDEIVSRFLPTAEHVLKWAQDARRAAGGSGN